MPGLNGVDLVSILRRNGKSFLPLLIYTAQDLTAAEKEELTLGLSNHLTKSATSEEELIGIVRKMLSELPA